MGLAVFLSFLLNDGGEVKLAAPVLCLLVLIPTSFYFGRLAGFIGSIAAGITLALLLFPPVGSLDIQEPAARVVMTLSQIVAMAVVVCSRAIPPPNRRGKSNRAKSTQDAALINKDGARA